MFNTQVKSKAWPCVPVTPEQQNCDLAGHQPSSKSVRDPASKGVGRE